VKNFLFDSLFLVNLMFSLKIFCVFEKPLCMAFYSSIMGVWNGSRWDSFQNPNFNAKNLFFIVSRSLTCVRIPLYVYVELKHACAYVCMRMHALGFPWFLYSKNSLFYS